MACHAQGSPIMSASKGQGWYLTPDNVSQCVRLKSANGMPRPTSFSIVCSLKVMMACHATSFDYVLSKGDACHGRRRLTSVLPKDHMGMQRPSSSDRACYPNTMMACHVRRRLTCIFSKGNDGIPCTISSVRECFPQTIMECHTRHCPIVYVLHGRRWHALRDTVR